MIHCETAVDVSCTNGAATPRRLVLQLEADTGPAGYKLHGVLEIEGLDAWRIEAMEAALARTLGGRCTLMLGPRDLDNVLDGANVEVAARRIAREYHLTADELAAKTGITAFCAANLLATDHKWSGSGRGKRHRSAQTIQAIAALAIRLMDAPTPGEILRRQRGGRSRRTVARDIGVSPTQLRCWEDDHELVPFELADDVRRALGIPPGGLQVAAPAPSIAPPPPAPDEIRAARTNLGLSQHALAERMGVRQEKVSAWERGASAPWPDNAAALRKALGLKPPPQETALAGLPAA